MCNSLGLLLFLTVAPGFQGGDSQGTTPFPGGVLDPSGKVCYVQAVNGGIEAIDLKNGKALWNTDSFARPLAVVGSKLLVQVPEKGKAYAVRVVTLDIGNKGKQLATSDMIQFPNWVDVGVAYGRTFTSRAALATDKNIALCWQATAFHAGTGYRPTPQQERAFDAAYTTAQGIAEVDLIAGKVKMMNDLPSEGLPRVFDNIKSAQYFSDLGFETKPLIIGDKVVVFDILPTPVNVTLTLLYLNKDTAKAEKRVELIQGKSVGLRLTADRRFLLVSNETWWIGIFSLDTGKQVGKLPPTLLVNDIQYADGLVFFVTDNAGNSSVGSKENPRLRELKAVDATNGTAVWQRAIYAPPRLPPVP